MVGDCYESYCIYSVTGELAGRIDSNRALSEKEIDYFLFQILNTIPAKEEKLTVCTAGKQFLIHEDQRLVANTYLCDPHKMTTVGHWCVLCGLSLCPPPTSCNESSVAHRPINSILLSHVKPYLSATANNLPLNE